MCLPVVYFQLFAHVEEEIDIGGAHSRLAACIIYDERYDCSYKSNKGA